MVERLSLNGVAGQGGDSAIYEGVERATLVLACTAPAGPAVGQQAKVRAIPAGAGARKPGPYPVPDASVDTTGRTPFRRILIV